MAKSKKPAKKPVTPKTPVASRLRGKGLTVKPIPDLSKRDLLKTPDNGSTLNLGNLRASPLLLLTPEQRAIKEAGEVADELLAVEGEIFDAVQTMIALRRGYAIAYREYLDLLAKKREEMEFKGETLTPMIEDFLVQYAMYESSKAFSEHQFMNAMINIGLRWLTDVIDRHTQQEQQERKEAYERAEEQRRKRPVPIGFRHSPQQEAPYLDKSRTLVLTGWSNALLWLVENVVCANVLGTVCGADEGGAFQIVRFMRTSPKSKDQDRQLIRLGANNWKGCGDSVKKLARTMGEFVADKLSSRPDLLIVDDLAWAYTLGFVGRPEAAVAGDAQRQLRKWCDQAGCALLGLVPFPDSATPDVTAPEWEQLRTFTHLRPVRVEHADETKYRLVVGNDAAVFEVEKTTLDSYGHGSIILPEGVDLL